MQEYLSRCLLLLFPLITVAGMQVGFLIDGSFVLGMQATEWSHALCREIVDALPLTYDCRHESVSWRTVLSHESSGIFAMA
jgi:hypothetical protein